MKKITISLLILISNLSYGFCQTDKYELELKELKLKIKSVENENVKLNQSLNDIKVTIERMNLVVDSLNGEITKNNNAIDKTSKDLGTKIDETDKTHGQKISAIDKSLSKSTLYGIIGVLLALVISALVYFFLGKRLKSNKTDVEQQISKTKQSLEEEGIKLDTKLTEVLETQLKIVQSERNSSQSSNNDEIDHSLALKVADEIMRINKNIANMDAATKGIKQLTASVKRIEDNFAANGYEMPDLLNKEYDSRNKMIATIQEDEELEKGKEIITKIIKPQVNYKGIMIQAAQVEVTVGKK
jgi:hypothetical protein